MVRRGLIVAAAGLGGCLSTPAERCADRDGDGWAGGDCPEARYLDCHDDDPAVHPGAAEPGDGATELDCDGEPWDGDSELETITTVDDAGDLDVEVAGLGLRFAAAEGQALASLHVEGGDELLYDGPMHERVAGVGAWDSFFSWRSTGGRGELVRTPGLLRFVVDWADGLDLSGTTTWTIHAGGRIYRREAFQLTTSPSSISLTGYVALREGAATFVDFQDNPNPPINVVFPLGTFAAYAHDIDTDARWLCAFDDVDGHEVGLAVRVTASATDNGVRVSMSQNDSGDPATRQVGLQYDWERDDIPQPGSYSANFLLVADLSDTEPCDRVAAAATAWRAPAELEVRGALLAEVDGEDGDGDGFAEGGGYWALTITQPWVELEVTEAGAARPGLTFRLDDLPDADPAVELERDGAVARLVRGRDYLLEAGEGTHWLVLAATAETGDVFRLVSP